jgi:hypothetical protein
MEVTIESLISDQPGYRLIWSALLALLYVETGRLAKAEPMLKDLMAGAAELPRQDRTRVAVMLTLGDIAVQVGDVNLCAFCHEQLAPFRGRIAMLGRAGVLGPVDPVLDRLAAKVGQA